jgi:sialate O-acetylesterase
MRTDGDTAIIEFSNVGGGLVSKGGELTRFEVAGPDGNFVIAQATIVGSTVHVRADAVKVPTFVRYGWADNPDTCNLYNEEGLPASPFTTQTSPG